MSARQTSIAQQLTDITECPICTEVFVDPRTLPCIHSFCFKCIDGYGRDRQAGEKMSCPMCRREFTVPESGLNGLPKNFFIEKMLAIRRASSSETPVECEVCINEKGTAAKYCADCQQHLCDVCASGHEKYKMFRGHSLIGLDDSGGLKGAELVRASLLLPTVCQKHKDKPLDVYCRDCKSAICVVCYIASHKQHDCSDINDVIETFRQQMTADVGNMTEGLDKLREMLANVEQQMQDLVKIVDETERTIEKKAEELKLLIDRNKQTLINELTVKKGEVGKQLENLTQEIKQQISFIENLKRYSDELLKKGAAGDVARETSVLHDRVEELLQFDAIEKSRNSMYSFDVKFTESTVITNSSNMIGDINVEFIPKGLLFQS